MPHGSLGKLRSDGNSYILYNIDDMQIDPHALMSQDGHPMMATPMSSQDGQQGKAVGGNQYCRGGQLGVIGLAGEQLIRQGGARLGAIRLAGRQAVWSQLIDFRERKGEERKRERDQLPPTCTLTGD